MIANGSSADGIRGSGGVNIPRSEIELIRQAVRNNWPIPDDRRAEIVEQQIAIATKDVPSTTNREATSAARCLAAMSKQNVSVALAMLDKVLPDQHEHHHRGHVDLAELIDEDEEYAEFCRQGIAAEGSADCHTGLLGGNGKSGEVAVRKAPHGHRPGSNGTGHGPDGRANTDH